MLPAILSHATVSPQPAHMTNELIHLSAALVNNFENLISN